MTVKEEEARFEADTALLAELVEGKGKAMVLGLNKIINYGLKDCKQDYVDSIAVEEDIKSNGEGYE